MLTADKRSSTLMFHGTNLSMREVYTRRGIFPPFSPYPPVQSSVYTAAGVAFAAPLAFISVN